MGVANSDPNWSDSVFKPSKLRGTGRHANARQAGRVITKIGKKAGVIVNDDDKPASSHDLRRSFGQRLADAGVPPCDLQAIMRHKEFSTTQKYYLRDNTAEQASRLAVYLGTSGPDDENKQQEQSTQPVVS